MFKLLQLYEDIKGDIYGKLYKGTSQPLGDFDKYAYGGFGTFFSTSKWLAQVFAKSDHADGYVYEAKLKPNLKIFDSNDVQQVEKLVGWYTYMLPNERVIDAKEICNVNRNWQYLEQNGVFEKLKRDGYDAVILNESGEHTLFIFTPVEDKLEYIKLISDNKSVK